MSTDQKLQETVDSVVSKVQGDGKPQRLDHTIILAVSMGIFRNQGIPIWNACKDNEEYQGVTREQFEKIFTGGVYAGITQWTKALDSFVDKETQDEE